jgi:hypothetical protein
MVGPGSTELTVTAVHIGARQPHARHHVDLVEPGPVVVGNVEEALGLEDAGIVDQDIDVRQPLGERSASRRRRDIGGEAGDPGAGRGPGDRGYRGVDLGLRPAVDHHMGPGEREAFGDRMADTGARTRDQRRLARKVDFHIRRLHHCEGDIGIDVRDRNRWSPDGDDQQESGAPGAASSFVVPAYCTIAHEAPEPIPRDLAYAASADFACTGPESRPLASTSRSTNSITAIGALSP